MSTLATYLMRLLIARFALLLIGMTMFLIGLDLMVNANSILAKEGDVAALGRYALLRSPTIVSDLIKIAALLAGLLTFASLIRHGELTAIWSTGVSHFGLFRRLLPVALLLGGVQFVVDDQAVPVSIDALNDWGVGKFERQRTANSAKGVTWLHVGQDIIRVPTANIGAASLSDFTIFERDAEGRLLARLDVASARYDGDTWALSDVSIRSSDGGLVRHEARRDLRIGLTPKSLEHLSTHPRHLSFDEIRRFASGDGQGTWALYLYQTWLYEKLVACLVPMLMLFLSVALAQQSQRAGRTEVLFLGGIVIGFAFFIFNGVTLAMGEVGLLPPLIASSTPVVAFTAIALSIVYWHELKTHSA
jgi:lipopolysaccharide export system permease protein